MTVNEIYKKYNINKGLQEHMLRVAAVAQLICDNFKTELDTESIVKACLLHDMGNLIKSKLDNAPELFEPEGVEYWEEKKAEMMRNYGEDVHEATNRMVAEITDNEKIRKTVLGMSFDDIYEISISGASEVQISLYADMRVGMFGIISLDDRFEDIKDRYVPRGHFSEEEVESRREVAKKIENKIFSTCTIQPEEINDKSTEPVQQELLRMKI